VVAPERFESVGRRAKYGQDSFKIRRREKEHVQFQEQLEQEQVELGQEEISPAEATRASPTPDFQIRRAFVRAPLSLRSEVAKVGSDMCAQVRAYA
jgi:hypothetical protein